MNIFTVYFRLCVNLRVGSLVKSFLFSFSLLWGWQTTVHSSSLLQNHVIQLSLQIWGMNIIVNVAHPWLILSNFCGHMQHVFYTAHKTIGQAAVRRLWNWWCLLCLDTPFLPCYCFFNLKYKNKFSIFKHQPVDILFVWFGYVRRFASRRCDTCWMKKCPCLYKNVFIAVCALYIISSHVMCKLSCHRKCKFSHENK